MAARGSWQPASKGTPAIQKARKGISDSSEFPLITNAGVARKSSVAHNGCGEKRLASDHIDTAAATQDITKAAGNGAPTVSPIEASGEPRNTPMSGGRGWPPRSS